MNGQLYWATGQQAKEEDLAGLVCDKYGDQTCINEMKGKEHNGQTWEDRFKFIESIASEL